VLPCPCSASWLGGGVFCPCLRCMSWTGKSSRVVWPSWSGRIFIQFALSLARLPLHLRSPRRHVPSSLDRVWIARSMTRGGGFFLGGEEIFWPLRFPFPFASASVGLRLDPRYLLDRWSWLPTCLCISSLVSRLIYRPGRLDDLPQLVRPPPGSFRPLRAWFPLTDRRGAQADVIRARKRRQVGAIPLSSVFGLGAGGARRPLLRLDFLPPRPAPALSEIEPRFSPASRA